MSLNFEGIDLPDDVKESLSNQVTELTSNMVSKDELSAVLAKNDELLTEVKKTKEQKRLEAEEKARLADEAAAKNGDVESLQKSLEDWKSKFNDLQTSIVTEKEQGAVKSFIDGVLNEHVTQDKAARLFIENELKGKVGFKEGQVMPINEDGTLSGATLSELVNALVSDPSNKPYMLASKADGGGASGSQNAGGGAASVPKSLADCKGDPEKERQYFANQRQSMA